MSEDISSHKAHFGGLGRDLGVVYRSGALLSDGTVPADSNEEYVPTAIPGSRTLMCG